MQPRAANQLLVAYYDATVLFIALDLLLGVNVRVAFLEGMPEWRTGYYALCLGCAAIMHLLPNLRVVVGAIEGMITIVGLLLGMYTGYMFSHVDSIAGFLQVLANYFISGYFAHASWVRAVESLRRLQTS
jgi:hypothetical protein